MSEAQVRDWRPGDGLRCSYAKGASFPCGPPVKTRVQMVTGQGRWAGLPPREMKRVLCQNHVANASADLHGTFAVEARRIATERLIREHWETYLKYEAEAVEQLCETVAVDLSSDESAAS